MEIPQYVSAAIRWAMQDYINRQHKQNHRGKPKSIIRSMEIEDEIMAPEDKRLQVAEEAECAHRLLHNPNVNLADRLLIDQRYFQGLQLKEIAKIHGCTKANIGCKLNKIIEKLKFVVGVA